MIKKNILFIFLLLPSFLFGSIDLNLLSQPFVLEKKQIKIPEYPCAYNPSIVRWNGSILMSFRILTGGQNVWYSEIGLVWLDDNFKPISKPVLLNTRKNFLYPSKAEDARLFTINNRLYILYNDDDGFHDEGRRRMFHSELLYDGKNFFVDPECINIYEGENPERWEKNWVPFDYHGSLLMAYSIVPHTIFLPLFDFGKCETVCSTKSLFPWLWGQKRIFGGTPALKIDDEYLAFFHSSISMASLQSNHQATWHYFMAAYKFSGDPPFAITSVSPMPIIGQGLYDNPLIYKRVVFPGSFIFDDRYIWVSYGREDTEAWVLKLDKKGLLNSLVPVKEIIPEK